MVSRSAVRPGGTTGDTIVPAGSADLLAPAAAAGAELATVRWETRPVVSESAAGDVAASVAESVAEVDSGSAARTSDSVPSLHARLRITEAPATPIAAITPSAIAMAVPCAIICRWRARRAARSAC